MLLGVHVTKSSKVLDDKKDAKDISFAINRDLNKLCLNSAQIFTYGPRFMVKNKIDYNKVKETCSDIDLTVHSAYSTVSIWKVNKKNKTNQSSKKYLDSIYNQIKSCDEIDAWGLVLHVTKQYADVVAESMKIIKPKIKKTGVKIILEMVSSKADDNKTYETPEKIDNLTTLIGPTEQWWGWCVDTAHLWGAGVDIKSYSSMSNWLNRITYKKKILMFHLNGSSAKCGSGKDKHEIAFSPNDLIWYGISPSKSGLRAVVEFAVKYNCTIICEINRGSEEDVISSLDIIKKIGGVYI
jgi:deoxyribonuclease-4